MKREGIIVVALALFAGVAYALRKPVAAPRAPGTTSIGPVEHVGPTGNTDPSWGTPEIPTTLLPPAGTTGAGSQPGYSAPIVPDLSTDRLAQCSPLDSFGPALIGNTWTAFLEENIPYLVAAGMVIDMNRARRLTRAQVVATNVYLRQFNAPELDPSKTFVAVDYRAKLPATCANSGGWN